MYELFVGIDPGASGAITILSSEGKILESFKIPLTAIDGWRSLEKYAEKIEKNYFFGMMEKNHAYPGNGATSAFTFGYNTCLAETIFLHNKIPHEKITPYTWMGYFGMKREKNENQTQWKNRLYGKAQQLFPNDRFYIYQADSILIAEYCRRKILNIKIG